MSSCLCAGRPKQYDATVEALEDYELMANASNDFLSEGDVMDELV